MKKSSDTAISTVCESVIVDDLSDIDKHWLYRQTNWPKLWKLQYLLLALALIPEFFVHHHAHFSEQDISIDASFGFFAWYGFATCALMVLSAKILALFLKKDENYYLNRSENLGQGKP